MSESESEQDISSVRKKENVCYFEKGRLKQIVYLLSKQWREGKTRVKVAGGKSGHLGSPAGSGNEGLTLERGWLCVCLCVLSVTHALSLRASSPAAAIFL